MSTAIRRRRGHGFRHPRQAAGVGLIEVLIATVILAFGLLGIAALQMATLKKSQSSLSRSQATVQTYAILDAMRANRDAARIGKYNLTTMTCAAPDPTSLAMSDLANWIGSLKRDLGESACAMVVCGSVECEISVQWSDERAKGDSSYTTRTVTRL
ncbi:type IV pilus modification protein PilV [Lysobacter solisilvae (ex Woo and Kim 2020)]|uniref:Type IV pilus modification protein PilV n=1 Tax=Agrilutibacter terrestris TaxID=2865112 RepID=A0A7H0FY41_9GAMM|nr:type IV pilus modification protein PilV [Lysobacter terrestris]QNP40957.1 type IV pilus modification protein PilV [Lysobacter terrestris]